MLRYLHENPPHKNKKCGFLLIKGAHVSTGKVSGIEDSAPGGRAVPPLVTGRAVPPLVTGRAVTPLVRTTVSVVTPFPICYAMCMGNHGITIRHVVEAQLPVKSLALKTSLWFCRPVNALSNSSCSPSVHITSAI